MEHFRFIIYDYYYTYHSRLRRGSYAFEGRGRVFTTGLILMGVGARALIEGEIREILGRRKLSKKIGNLKNHYIICGYGRMGKIICKEMIQNKAHFIIVEKNPEVLRDIVISIIPLQDI